VIAYRPGMNRIALLCFVAACSGASTPAPTPTPTPTPTPDPTQAPPAAAEPGSPCSAEGTCGAPLECVKYSGIAGPKGPQFSSCEIRCGEKQACPAGLDCVTVADGPGQVCRKK